jgi:3-oxoacyl-[acyl-carrier protein] reductase
MMLEGRLALITGGAQGIGKAIATRLAMEGATIAIADIMQDAAKETARELADKSGVKVSGFHMDVSNSASVEDTFAKVNAEMGTVGILINNAGITRDNILIRMKDDEWQKVLNINLTGAFNCCRTAIKDMVKNRWGRIVNITSVVGMKGNVGQVNYASSKAGLIGMAITLAKEYASRGVTVNCIAPGYIRTPMTDDLKPDVRDYWLSKIPVRRFGEAVEIAGVAAFLCGPDAAYITGEVIRVDGGTFID